MKILFLLTGKTTAGELLVIQRDYEERIKHYVTFETKVIPELKNAKSLTESEIREKEAALQLKQFDKSDAVILLDDRGKQFSSRAFSDFVAKKTMLSARRLVFVVGGAYGFSQSIYERSDEKISLSAMTFPHQLVRVIFLEQLYRAFTIINGEPYHHD
jgi:23S rRNA (pseudouridine1915-N3)-methyltransferase